MTIEANEFTTGTERCLAVWAGVHNLPSAGKLREFACLGVQWSGIRKGRVSSSRGLTGGEGEGEAGAAREGERVKREKPRGKGRGNKGKKGGRGKGGENNGR